MLRNKLFPLVFLCLFFLGACDEAGWDSNGGGGGGGNGDGNSFFGPGDIWELSFEDETNFSLSRWNAVSDAEPAVSAEGTYETLSTGFMRFTVTNPPSGINGAFAGLEIGNETILLGPVENNSQQILALIDANTCPTAIVDGGWIKFRFAQAADTSSANERYFGTWRYNPNNSDNPTFSYREDYSLNDMSQTGGGETRDSAECDDGLAIGEMYSDFLGSAYMVASIDKDVTQNNEFVFGFPTTAITSTPEFNGNYIGFQYQNQNNTFSTVSASCTDGTCNLYSVANINTVNNSSQIFTLVLDNDVDQPQQGFITGQLQNLNNQVGNIACGVVIDVNTNDNDFLACVGQYPAATIADAVNFFLISTD